MKLQMVWVSIPEKVELKGSCTVKVLMFAAHVDLVVVISINRKLVPVCALCYVTRQTLCLMLNQTATGAAY